jgi:cytidine kinase
MNDTNEPDSPRPPALCVIGHVSIDEVIAPDGVYHSHVGGSAYATAVGAALVTHSVGIVSRVGMDFPMQTRLFQRIDHRQILRVPDGRTSRFYLDYLQADVARGFRGELGVGADIAASDIPEGWRAGSWVYVATMPPAQQLAIFRDLGAYGCARLSTDLLEAYVRAEPLLSLAAANLVDLLFVNEFEWGVLQSLNCRRQGLTVIKRGALGAAVYLGEKLLVEKPSHPATAIDPTNAGDVFAGAFLARLIETASYEAALDAALKAGARCVEVRCPDMLLEDRQTGPVI